MTRGLKKPICKQGHDKRIVGYDANYYCKECRRQGDHRRIAEETRQRRRERGYSHRIEWERARVATWRQIVEADPLVKTSNTRLRRNDFQIRYEKLEAAVPTPGQA